ncbi:ATP-dependent DNA helicase [Trichonephila clavipes]|nr:ATP-dependent DNA helicase [Trichonephila clavipes]
MTRRRVENREGSLGYPRGCETTDDLKDDSTQIFTKQFLDTSNGKLTSYPSTQEISFPQDCNLQSSIEDLKKMDFPNITNSFRNHDWLCECVILAPKNDDVNRINNRIQLKIPGAVTEYKSIAIVMEENGAVNYPVEFLNCDTSRPGGITISSSKRPRFVGINE